MSPGGWPLSWWRAIFQAVCPTGRHASQAKKQGVAFFDERLHCEEPTRVFERGTIGGGVVQLHRRKNPRDAAFALCARVGGGGQLAELLKPRVNFALFAAAGFVGEGGGQHFHGQPLDYVVFR